MRCDAILEGREWGLVLKLLASEQRREASGRAAMQQQPAPRPRPSASVPCCPEDLRARLHADGLRTPPVDLPLRRRPPCSARGSAPTASGLHARRPARLAVAARGAPRLSPLAGDRGADSRVGSLEEGEAGPTNLGILLEEEGSQ